MLTEFAPRKVMRDGVHPRCHDCRRQQHREWGRKNAEKRAEHNRRYYAKKRGEILANRKPEDKVAKAARWQRYASANVDYLRVSRMGHRVRRKGVIGQLSQDDRDYAAILFHDPCAYCDAPMTDLDHIQPLKGGGSGGWENLTASCRRCNAAKHATALLVFLARA